MRIPIALFVLALALAGCGRQAGVPAPTLADPLVAETDPRLSVCNDQFAAPVNVRAAFEIPAGLDYRAFLPEMGISPELEGWSGAFVIVYQGPHTIRFLGGQPGVPKSPTKDNVVCVVKRDGTPSIYSDVSMRGLVVPSPLVPLPSGG